MKGRVVLLQSVIVGTGLFVPKHSPVVGQPRAAAILDNLAAPNRRQALDIFGGLPLSFEPNLGQTDRRVRWLCRTSSYNLFLTSTEALLVFPRWAPASTGQSMLQPARVPTASLLRITLVGADPLPRVSGVDALAGRSNYFIGNDPAKWRTNVPHYRRVRYQAVYPGIDLEYYGTHRRLEYDFVVAPGVDPKVIRMAFHPAHKLEMTPEGDLLLGGQAQALRLRRPYLYQEVEGVRREVSGGFMLFNDREAGFKIGRYDASRHLVIDPALGYSTYLGGSLADLGMGISVDSSGNAYVTGYTVSPDFPTTPGAFDRACGTDGLCNFLNLDAFVTKIDASGSSIVFSTFYGGADHDYGYGIGVDDSGVYATGYTASGDLPAVSAFQARSGGGQDIFIAKFGPQGSQLHYSTYLGGSADDVTFAGVAVERGSVFVTGYTTSADFPVTAGALDRRCGADGACDGGRDAFVARLDPSAPAPASLGYSTYLGGSKDDEGRAVAVDAEGNAYTTGYTASPDFPVTTGASDGTCGTDGACNGGLRDAFVTKLAPASGGLAALVFSTYVGGSGTDVGRSLAVDSSGVYLTGSTASHDFTATRAPQPKLGGGFEDGFVMKLTSAGTAVIYSTYLGGSGEDVSHSLAVDRSGSVHLTGYTTSDDFPTANPLQATRQGREDAFVTTLNPDGSAWDYSTYLGGCFDDRGFDIASDPTGSFYVTGYTASPDFPTTPAAFRKTAPGLAGTFVAKFLGPPHIHPGGVVNAASFEPGAAVAPGGIASVFGLNLAPGQASAKAGPLPAVLLGSSVRIGGHAAPLFFVSPSQINIQVPWELAGQAQASVTVSVGGVTSGAQTVRLAPFGPGLFAANAAGAGQGIIVIAGSGSIAAPLGVFPESRPALRGEWLSIFCTGLGAVTNPPSTGAPGRSAPLSETTTAPVVTIGGHLAAVGFAGLGPGFVGVYQVNVRAPEAAPAGDAVPVVLSIGGIKSNTVTLAVR